MKPKPDPKALASQHAKPCFVCDTPTKRIRSGTHLHGPPSDPQDFTRICLACDADWTAALHAELTINRPSKK